MSDLGSLGDPKAETGIKLEPQTDLDAATMPQQPDVKPATTPSAESKTDGGSIEQVLEFLRKHNMQETIAQLQVELTKTGAKPIEFDKSKAHANEDAAKVNNQSAAIPSQDSKPSIASISSSASTGRGDAENVLSSYSSTEGDPSVYAEAYQALMRFVDKAPDLYKYELALILHPVFVHMYLELVYNGHEEVATEFMAKFGPLQETYYADGVRKLSFITKKQHMLGSELMENFKTAQFTVRMSRDTYSQLRQQRKFMSEKKYSILWNIIQEHLYLDVYEGIARNKKQVAATSGSLIGEANRVANRGKIFYGLPRETDMSSFLPTEDEPEEQGDKPKKKKKKEAMSLKKQKIDPNAPPPSRIPFPELRDSEKAEKAKAWKDSQRRQILGPESPVSVCYYTVQNAGFKLCVVEVSDDSSLLAAGFDNAHIKIFSLVSSKLRTLKNAEALSDLDQDSDDILYRMMDESSGEPAKLLLGHSGAVYGLAFNPDKSLLLSSSEDGTIRLWSLQTWTCLVCYKGHLLPVWQVKFCNQGYYFASCGHDRTVRLWCTEMSHCIRIFAGHVSDVDCIDFHPNCNYVASGSSDRSVRLWDCLTGACVRLMTGHKAAVSTLCFAANGRILASGGLDSRVLLWDTAHGHLLADFSMHSSLITSLTFSRDGNVMVSASRDCKLILWDFARFMDDLKLEEVNVTQNPQVKTDISDTMITCFRTKESPILGTHFTRRNLLIGIGTFTG